jgi:hypothetical protein
MRHARIERAPATAAPPAVATEPGPHATASVRAAVVLGEDLDILVSVAAIQLVFDAEIRKMHGPVEVRKLVVTGPCFDFMRVPIRASVAVGPTAIVLLEKPLVLGLEVLLEDHTADLPTLFAETLLGTAIG